MRRQTTEADFITACEKCYAVRNDVGTQHCPTCGKVLDEEHAVHDGYSGSPYAHGGIGSTGMANHHFFLICEDCSTCDCELCQKYKNCEDVELARVLDQLIDDCNLYGGYLCRYHNTSTGQYSYSVIDYIPDECFVLLPVSAGNWRDWAWFSANENRDYAEGINWNGCMGLPSRDNVLTAPEYSNE
jgi:hypothetical protein